MQKIWCRTTHPRNGGDGSSEGNSELCHLQEAECKAYEEKIASYGGIDLFLAGIGTDGKLPRLSFTGNPPCLSEKKMLSKCLCFLRR